MIVFHAIFKQELQNYAVWVKHMHSVIMLEMAKVLCSQGLVQTLKGYVPASCWCIWLSRCDYTAYTIASLLWYLAD